MDGVSTVSLISAILLLFSIPVLLMLRADRVIYYTLPFVLITRHMPYLYIVSNGVIAIVVIISVFKMGMPNGARFFKPRLVVKNPFFYISLLLLMVYLVSFLIGGDSSADAVDKHREFLVSLFFVFIYGYLLISFLHSEQHLIGISKVILAVFVLNVIFAVFSAFIGESDFLGGFIRSGTVEVGSGADNARRLGGLFFYWEAFSQYLAMTLIVIAATLFRLRGTNRFLLLLLFFAGVIELLLTNSRGSVIVFGLGAILLVLLSGRLSGSTARAVGLMLILCLAVVGSIFIAEVSGLLSLQERFSLLMETVRTDYGDLPAARAEVWVRALDSASNSLWIGHGPSFYPLSPYNNFSGKLLWPHNLALLIVNTIGLVGLAIYSLMLAWVIKILWSAGSTCRNPLLKAITAGACIGWVMFFVESMKFDGWLRMPDSWFYYVWILLAVSFSVRNLRKQLILREARL